MNQALYRKYRSKSLDEVIGQDHVTKTIGNAIKTGRISHAYLFTGPRGVGKTSVARILAHEVNQLPYKDESIHLDIIEIDAASNRRIDEIRDLRERVRIAPTSAKYKVYIIDEVHMLTREAFNALLKTLEEPPAHCIFILATTEAHKLPETIISRTQRFEFKPIDPSQASKHLKSIAKKENIDISQAALELLAEFSSGSFRDSIGYLDQLSSSGQSIGEEDVRRILGLPSQTEVHTLLRSLMDGDSQKLINTLQAIREQGISAPELAVAISKELRQELIKGNGGPADAALLKQLIDVKGSSRPYDHLEVVLLESTVKRHQDSHDRPPSHTDTKSKQSKEPAETPAAPPAAQPAVISAPVKTVAFDSFELSAWDEIVNQIKSQAASLYTALRLAQPSLDGSTLILSFQFPLHKKKVEQSKNKALIADVIEKMTGVKVRIDCVVDKSLTTASPPAAKSEEAAEPVASLNSITNIFGSAEMIES